MKMTSLTQVTRLKRAKLLSFKTLEVRKSCQNLVLHFGWNLKVTMQMVITTRHSTHRLYNLNDASISHLSSWQKLYLTLRGNISILTGCQKFYIANDADFETLLSSACRDSFCLLPIH